jgi:predicted nucleic acid-binding protein
MFEILVDEEFGGRVAQFDRAAGNAAGQLAARREANGGPNDVLDTLIAGVALPIPQLPYDVAP